MLLSESALKKQSKDKVTALALEYQILKNKYLIPRKIIKKCSQLCVSREFSSKQKKQIVL